jgi:hypothetical protein
MERGEWGAFCAFFLPACMQGVCGSTRLAPANLPKSRPGIQTHTLSHTNAQPTESWLGQERLRGCLGRS